MRTVPRAPCANRHPFNSQRVRSCQCQACNGMEIWTYGVFALSVKSLKLFPHFFPFRVYCLLSSFTGPIRRTQTTGNGAGPGNHCRRRNSSTISVAILKSAEIPASTESKSDSLKIHPMQSCTISKKIT